MVTVDEYARIRRAHRDGMSVRLLAKTFHHSRDKIREIITCPEPKSYQRLKPLPSVLDPFKGILDQLILDDDLAPRKQRHTAMKLFRRLKQEHGFTGSYERVRLYVRGQERERRETFIPLDHDPAQRLEADFGHVYVDFPDGRRQVPILLVTWSYSNCPFAIALPTERTEAILHGMVEAFKFFGCVPHQVWWDNATTLVPNILVGRQRQINGRYQALASHYNFEPLFCMVRRPQEKPRVEGRVQFLQQEWCTPVPAVKDLAQLNAHLRDCCLRERERTQAGQSETIGQRFRRDSDNAVSLPQRPFDPCIVQPAQVDKYQTIRFDHNNYSAPRAWAFRKVTVKAYVEHIEIVADGQTVARHPRCYGKSQQILDPLHYLVSLGRKPAALDHANVYRRWQLPAIFGQLRQDLEAQHGPTSGARQYIRVLQCLAQYAVAQVERAIHLSRVGEHYAVDTIMQRLRREADKAASAQASDLTECQPHVIRVHVPLVNLRQFDQFLSSQEMPYVPGNQDRTGRNDAGEGQSEATALAHHACRIREAGPGGGQRQRELRAVPAASDRTGGDGPLGQRAGDTHQERDLPDPQGLRHL
jgi:transposase